MVDAPASICFQRTRRPVIPKSILLPVRIEFHKHVLKSPRQCMFIRSPRILVIADVFEMLLGAVHVDRPRSNVHVTTPNSRFVWRHMLLEILSKSIIPAKLVLILR